MAIETIKAIGPRSWRDLICVSGSATNDGGLVFRSNCGAAVMVHWCFSSGPVCQFGQAAGLAPGASYTTYFGNQSTIWYAACPSFYEGRSVYTNQVDGLRKYTCSYYSR
ncbi:hypothetical protein [Pseudoduganella namucuonensis]|uniref:Uncharacterized protein n=1 Tax=Pseudoduganella namucuonensis TaxID=1035707 RepID=A0A1I7JQF9_9BURK|nr:hypothetical protein [Pseudoduganella namucuonensis]SFU87433.1 hypothetical protein SAMN05216552_1012157 [Pseudoduganella namucuonensis]